MRSVRVATTARLHLGFLDLNGGLGRRLGSIGLSIDAFETQVEIVPGGEFQTLGHEQDRSVWLALRVADRLRLNLSGKLTVSAANPGAFRARFRHAAGACDRERPAAPP